MNRSVSARISSVSYTHLQQTGQGLQGAQIGLYDSHGVQLLTVETNEEGYVDFSYLTPGRYYFCEIVAPPDYQLNDATYQFEVLEDGTIQGDSIVLNDRMANPKTGDSNTLVRIVLLGLGMMASIGGIKMCIRDRLYGGNWHWGGWVKPMAQGGGLETYLATQALIWETVIGERDETFTHIAKPTWAAADSQNAKELYSGIETYETTFQQEYARIEMAVQNHMKRCLLYTSGHRSSWA